MDFDFSKVDNIIYLASTGAAFVLMLAFLLALIVKGKHKTGAFDIIARLLSVIVLIGSFALSAAAVLAMLKGNYRIDATEEAATLVFGEKVIELPIPQLFYILTNLIGAVLCFAPFVLSLIVLIVDGALARKNYEAAEKGKKKAVDNRTPEQKKRDAEIEKIRRLAASAVKKTSAAASNTAKDSTKPGETSTETQKPKDTAANPSEEKPDFDWRVDRPEKPKSTEFVGLSETDGERDSFDSFDSDYEETSAPKGDGSFDSFTVSETGGDDDIDDTFDDAPAEEIQRDDEEVEDQPEEEVYDEVVEEHPEEEVYDEAVDEQPEEEVYDEVVEEQPEEEVYDEAVEEQLEEEVYDDVAEEQTEEEVYDEAVDEQTEEEVYDEVVDEQPEEEVYDEVAEEQPEEEVYDEAVDEQPEEEVYDELGGFDIDDIEPNRDIYIPEIRTITRQRTDSSEQIEQDDNDDGEPLVMDEPVVDEPIITEEPVQEEPEQEERWEEPVYEEPVKPSYEPPVKPSYEPPVRTRTVRPAPRPVEPIRPTPRPERRVGPDPNAKIEHDETVKKKIEQVRRAHESEAAKRRESVKKPTESAPVSERPRRSTPPLDGAKKTVTAPRQTSASNSSAQNPTGDNKRLPLTRRYVIINRTSAVNIFNDYLKERGKEKLDSMVTTIILK